MGDAMILNSTLKLLREVLGKADLTVLSFNPTIDVKRCDVSVIEAIGKISLTSLPRTLSVLSRSMLWTVLQRCLHLNVNSLINDYVLQKYAKADVVIVRGGDTLTNDYGFLPLTSHLTSMLFAVLLRKPIILLGHTIGPFGILKCVVRYVLDRTDIIVLREEQSREILQDLGIDKPAIYVTADLSFLSDVPNVETVERILFEEGIKKNTKIVGVSVSQIFPGFLHVPRDYKGKRERYVELMAQTIDYLISNLGVSVIVVPNVLGPGDNDDRMIATEIYSKVNSKEKVKLIVNEYSPEELKGIISHCEMFIGARMHACIAALSTCVPTISLAYGHKFDGIIGRMLDQEKYVLKATNLNYDMLVSKIKEVWSAREEIRKDLQIKIKAVRKRAKQNFALMTDFLKSLEVKTIAS